MGLYSKGGIFFFGGKKNLGPTPKKTNSLNCIINPAQGQKGAILKILKFNTWGKKKFKLNQRVRFLKKNFWITAPNFSSFLLNKLEFLKF